MQSGGRPWQEDIQDVGQVRKECARSSQPSVPVVQILCSERAIPPGASVPAVGRPGPWATGSPHLGGGLARGGQDRPARRLAGRPPRATSGVAQL